MKVVVVGGGSTYTPELVDGLLRRRSALPIDRLVLLDPDEHRREVIAGFVRRMAQDAGVDMHVTTTDDQDEAVRDAAFVFSQFRIGGQAARDGDERLGRRWGIVGQETTGIGGLAKGLRTIPVALALQRAVAELARPDAWLVNFTNPAGMVTEALLAHGAGVPPRVIGLCNFPWVLRVRLAAALRSAPDDIDLDYVGLNHLAWVRSVRVRDADRTVDAFTAWRAGTDAPFASTLLDDLRMILNPYLQYYYETSLAVQRQRQEPTRASVVASLEESLLETYADPLSRYTSQLLLGRGGASYSEAAAALAADLAGAPAPRRHVLNVRNGGAIPGLPADAVVETVCEVDTSGAHPVPTAELGPPARGLANQVKDFERYAVAAAVTGDPRAARLAILTHPLCPDHPRVAELLDELLRVNERWLPHFRS